MVDGNGSQGISIHALREEGDRTPPCPAQRMKHFYPRPPRGGRHRTRRWDGIRKTISIHALREEGDKLQTVVLFTSKNFYPRPPRGGRPGEQMLVHVLESFLSTPSARRATCAKFSPTYSKAYFYPRPPRGGRRVGSNGGSIRTYFYPRPPRGGRPTLTRTTPPLSRNFYPRPPRGGRLPILGYPAYFPLFLSTPSARRATVACAVAFRQVRISIHALREEGDLTEVIEIIPITNFYPRPPRGGRRRHRRRQLKNTYISIHALREEGDNPLTERT